MANGDDDRNFLSRLLDPFSGQSQEGLKNIGTLLTNQSQAKSPVGRGLQGFLFGNLIKNQRVSQQTELEKQQKQNKALSNFSGVFAKSLAKLNTDPNSTDNDYAALVSSGLEVLQPAFANDPEKAIKLIDSIRQQLPRPKTSLGGFTEGQKLIEKEKQDLTALGVVDIPESLDLKGLRNLRAKSVRDKEISKGQELTEPEKRQYRSVKLLDISLNDITNLHKDLGHETFLSKNNLLGGTSERISTFGSRGLAALGVKSFSKARVSFETRRGVILQSMVRAFQTNVSNFDVKFLDKVLPEYYDTNFEAESKANQLKIFIDDFSSVLNGMPLGKKINMDSLFDIYSSTKIKINKLDPSKLNIEDLNGLTDQQLSILEKKLGG